MVGIPFLAGYVFKFLCARKAQLDSVGLNILNPKMFSWTYLIPSGYD